MNIVERQKIYEKIERTTGNPLIIYATSRRPQASGMIAGDSVDEFIEQLEAIKDADIDTIDILLESNGGDAVVIWRLISILRARAKRIRALVPHSAFSAATLFCLGADEVVMGKYASLGPTDPQISVMGKDGAPKNFAFEDVLAFIEFVKKKFGLSRLRAKESLNRIFDSVEPFSLGFASRSSELSISMGAKLLQTHKDEKFRSWRARAISNKLNKSFFNHGHPLNKAELLGVGLNITDPSPELEKLMWEAHKALDGEFSNKKPFDFLCNYLQNNPPLVMGAPTIPLGEYDFELKFVIIESSRQFNDYYVKYRTTVYRDGNANYHPINVATWQGWRN